MAEITTGTTRSADGTEIGYFRRGSGPALVITHGSVATKEQWLAASEFLAADFTVYVYDRRSRGATGDGEAYSLQTEVEDIAAMRAVAGAGSHLLGHSYGALCALAYAEQHGLDGGGLVAYEPPLAVQGPVAGPRLPAYISLIESGDLDAAFEYALVEFVRVPAIAIPAIRETPLWSASVPLAPTWVRELQAIDALGADLAHYGSISDPTLLIAGTATSPFLYQSVTELAEVIRNARVHAIEEADHFAHLQDPAGFSKVVLAGLSRDAR